MSHTLNPVIQGSSASPDVLFIFELSVSPLGAKQITCTLKKTLLSMSPLVKLRP